MKTVVISRAAVHTGSLILVNPAHPVRNIPLREELQPPFDSAPQILLQRRAAVMLRCLTADIGAEKKILPVSGYRTGREQQKLYAETMAEKGEDFTRKFVAIPGCSEHETGLAVDLAEKGPEIDFIRPSFPDTGLCGTFRRRAAAYGFIQRYQPGKEVVTKIAPEPWHFRYVGVPHGMVMESRGFSLEEYVDFLRDFSPERPLSIRPENGREAKIYFLAFGKDETMEMSLSEKNPYLISGNNIDGVVITIWNANQ